MSEKLHNARFLCVQFANIVALQSADAVGVAKGTDKGLKAVELKMNY